MAMDRAAIRQTLLELVQEEKGEKFDGLEDGVRLREELGLDSIDLVTLVISIQTRFSIELEAAELEKVLTVGDMLDLLQNKLASGRAAA
jgi:acyl carrier protein